MQFDTTIVRAIGLRTLGGIFDMAKQCTHIFCLLWCYQIIIAFAFLAVSFILHYINFNFTS